MNLRHLEFVVAAGDLKSFSRAAERCNVTQPTLSHGIALLEAEFGGRLFVRTTRKVDLSPFGEQLFPLIQAILRAHDELRSGLRAHYDPPQKLIRVGLSPLVDARRVTDVLERYELRSGDYRTFFKECFLDDLEERLYSAQLDMAVRPTPRAAPGSRAMIRIPFYDEELFYLPRGGSAGDTGDGSPVALRHIVDQTFVLGPDGCGLAAIIRGLFKRSGVVLKEYRGQALSYQVMQEWADLGIGATIITASKISPQFRARARPLQVKPGQVAKVSFEAVWMSQGAHPRHIAALHQHFQERAPRILRSTAARSDRREALARKPA
jgi:DNA-binding transcriptional LysR family regulator